MSASTELVDFATWLKALPKPVPIGLVQPIADEATRIGLAAAAEHPDDVDTQVTAWAIEHLVNQRKESI